MLVRIMLSRRAFGIALGLALSAAPAVLHAGACARLGGRVLLVTPTNEDLPPDAALVLAVNPYPNGVSPFDGEQFPNATYLTKGRARIALRLEVLAPGLARLVPAQPPSSGVWTLRGGARTATVRFGSTAKPAPAAPAVRRLRQVSHGSLLVAPGPSSGHSGPSSWETVELELRGNPPASVYAVIARWGGAASPPGVFAPVVAGTPALSLWTDYIGRCAYHQPGILAPSTAASPSTALRYVDVYGRVSADTVVTLVR